MGNIIDYVVEYGAYSFRERPFSVEDALVLAQFAYLKLEGLVPAPGGQRDMAAEAGQERRRVTIGEIWRRQKPEQLFADRRFADDNQALFQAMQKSLRFQRVGFSHYVNQIDRKQAIQFAAVTCLLDEELLYVAYRGTDETLAGWREDMEMLYRMPVPSQQLAVAYLEQVAGECPGRLLVGGHSKGGNLAVYASMYCSRAVQERIGVIYDLDGLGFSAAAVGSDAWRAVADRVCKVVPHSAVIGMLLEDTERYLTVESSSFGIWQHNPFSWVLQEGRFTAVEDVYPVRKRAGRTFRRWLGMWTAEELDQLVENLFAILEKSGAETLPELSAHWNEAIWQMLHVLPGLDREKKRMLWNVCKGLLTAEKEEKSMKSNPRQ